MKALIIGEGIHPPWNKGESVAARNFIEVLALTKMYDELLLLTSIEESRLHSDTARLTEEAFAHSNVNTIILHMPNEIEYYSIKMIKNLCRDSDKAHVYFIQGLPLGVVENTWFYCKEKVKIFALLFSYKDFGKPTIKLYLMPLAASLIKHLNVITTSMKYYNKYKEVVIGSKYFWIPLPLSSSWIAQFNNSTLKNRSKQDSIPKIVIIGHPHYKRIPYDKILKAFIRLKREFSTFQVTMLISRRKERSLDFTYFEKNIVYLIQKYDLSKYIKLYIKNLTEREKVELMQTHDILIYPALSDAAIDPPLTVLEGMSAGLCVIATNVQSLPLLLNSERGIVINRINFETELQRALLEVLSNSHKMKSLSENAFKYIHTHYTPYAVSGYLRKIIEMSNIR